MKLSVHNNKLETNVLDAQTQDFGIGDASVVIDILRNRLYEHKIQTLAQEYICNARDAMRECGKGNDFEVTCPTSLNPVFKVRDFGPGISPDRMANVFIKYGSSTKRNSNNQTGGFGIGAKSAWSYTDSFTITTFIDGVKRVYVAHIGVNNQGRLDHVSEGPTSEKNGTEIQIPVGRYDIQEFRNAIYRAVYFWADQPKLRGGDTEVPTHDGGLRINDIVEVIDSNMVPSFVGGPTYYNPMLAVIDGVPYPINQKLFEKCKKLKELKELNNKGVILHFGNGIVEVSASRESIADSPASIQGLDSLATKAIVAIKTKITSDFGKVKSTSDFFKTYTELCPYFNVDKFAKFGQYEINGNDVKSGLLEKVRITHIHNLSKRGKCAVEKITKDVFEDKDKKNGLRLEHMANLYFLRGGESAIIQNKRIREQTKDGKRCHIILIEPVSDVLAFNTIVTDLNAKDFQSLSYTELPKEQRVKITRDKQELCLHKMYGERHKYITLAENSQKWIFVQMDGASWPSGYNDKELKDLASWLGKSSDGSLCGVSERVAKIVKVEANFTPLADWLKNFKPSKKQLAYVKMTAAKNNETMELISRLKGIKNKFLVEMIDEYKGIVRNNLSVDPLPDMLVNLVKETSEYKEFQKKDETLSKLIKEKYALLNAVDSYNVRRGVLDAEMTFYINAKKES